MTDAEAIRWAPLVKWQAMAVLKKLPPGDDLADLIGAGNVGLCKAAAAFDHGRGFEFSTFAVPWIRGAMLDSLAGMWRQSSDCGYPPESDRGWVFPWEGPAQDDPEAALTIARRIQAAEARAARLSPRAQDMLRYRLGGEPVASIGARMGVTGEAVSKAVHDALHKMLEAADRAG